VGRERISDRDIRMSAVAADVGLRRAMARIAPNAMRNAIA
jgi:hypothetical protein